MDVGIPPLGIKIMFESNPLKSIMLVQRLAVAHEAHCAARPAAGVTAGRAALTEQDTKKCTRLVSNSAPTWSSRCCFTACQF